MSRETCKRTPCTSKATKTVACVAAVGLIGVAVYKFLKQ